MLSSSAETKFFSCPHCHSLFDGIKKLQIHSLQAHRVELSSNYSGLVSSLDSSRIDDLVPRPYACHVCGHMFVDEALRDNHVAKRHNTYFCEFCPLVFNLDSSRQVHMRKAHGARVITEDDTEDAEADHQINRFSAQHSAYQCRYCNGHFDNLENCLAHEQINHRATEDLPTVDGTNLPMSESDEETEMDGATLDKRLACEFCHRLYKNKENLKKHRRSSHAQELNEKLKLEGPTAAEIVRETCEYCGKYFSNLANLQRHVMNHLMTPCSSGSVASNKPEEICYCRHCGKQFASRAVCRFHETCAHEYKNLQTTTEISSPSSKIFCHFCGQEFHDDHLYRQHTNEHEKEVQKKFWCSICDQEQPSMDLLLSHMDQHATITSESGTNREEMEHRDAVEEDIDACESPSESGPSDMGPRKPGRKPGASRKKYNCYFCSKAYDCHSDMLRHERAAHWDAAVGSGYKCKLCGKAFQRRSQLNGHTAQHREKVHRCKYCELGFPRVIERRQHERDCEVRVRKKIPIVADQLVCGFCGQRFLNAIFCRRHEQRQHGSSRESLLRCTTCGEVLPTTAEWSSHKETCPFGEMASGDYELLEDSEQLSVITPDNQVIGKTTESKPFSCGWCDMTFTFAEECGIHEEELHGA